MIEGKQFPIKDVFSDRFVFAIPLYQRPYAWTTEEAGALLEDIQAFMDSDGTDNNAMNEYFLGSIVLIKGGSSSEAEVIDGQQRLTTLTILLAVMRGLSNEKFGHGLSHFICEEGNPAVLHSKDRYRLTLRKRDAQFFREHLQAEDGISRLQGINEADLTEESHRNIYLNTLHYQKQLANTSPEEIERLATFIINKCYLVLVWTTDKDSAFRIFSILNDRGLDLSHTDILKSEILGGLAEGEQQLYTDKWEDVENGVGRDGFEDLFGHIRMIKMKEKARKTILEEIRSHIQPAKDPKVFIDNTLIPYADAFSVISDANYLCTSGDFTINSNLKWLNRIDNFDWMPPAILYFSKHKNDPQKLEAFVEDLERLTAGMLIMRKNVNQRIARYAEVLTSIEGGDDLSVPNSPLQLTADEKKDTLSSLNGDIYLMTRVRLYVLLRLDSALASGAATYNYSVITVEHVLPQTPEPKSEWLTWYGDQATCDRWVHKIGNLLLLSRRKNSQAKNYEFDKKKKLYFSLKGGVANFAMTTRVLGEPDWKPQVIQRNQGDYITALKTLWRLS